MRDGLRIHNGRVIRRANQMFLSRAGLIGKRRPYSPAMKRKLSNFRSYVRKADARYAARRSNRSKSTQKKGRGRKPGPKKVSKRKRKGKKPGPKKSRKPGPKKGSKRRSSMKTRNMSKKVYARKRRYNMEQIKNMINPYHKTGTVNSWPTFANPGYQNKPLPPLPTINYGSTGGLVNFSPAMNKEAELNAAMDRADALLARKVDLNPFRSPAKDLNPFKTPAKADLNPFSTPIKDEYAGPYYFPSTPFKSPSMI